MVNLVERPSRVISIPPLVQADLATTQRWRQRRRQTAYPMVLATEVDQPRTLGYAAFNQTAQRRRVETINQYLSGPTHTATVNPWAKGGLGRWAVEGWRESVNEDVFGITQGISRHNL